MHGDRCAHAEGDGRLLESLIEDEQMRLDDGVEFQKTPAGGHDGGGCFTRPIEKPAEPQQE